MNNREMEKIVRRILAQTMGEEAENTSWNLDTDLINEIGMDSLQTVQFLLALEDELGVRIDYENLNYDDLTSLRAFLAFLEKNTVQETV